jgi:hypothetical protein
LVKEGFSTLFVSDLLAPALAIGHAWWSYQEAVLPSKISACFSNLIADFQAASFYVESMPTQL